MWWCWRHCGLRLCGGRIGCSASGEFGKVVARYGGTAVNKDGAKHPRPGYGRCMFNMVMWVNGHRVLENLGFRLLHTC